MLWASEQKDWWDVALKTHPKILQSDIGRILNAECSRDLLTLSTKQLHVTNVLKK